MKLPKIANVLGISMALSFGAVPAGWAAGAGCPITPKATTSSNQSKGFFSPANPLNPMAMVPQKDMSCETAMRNVEQRVNQDLIRAKIRERKAGIGETANVRHAAMEQSAGSAALDQGYRTSALNHFRAAERDLMQRG